MPRLADSTRSQVDLFGKAPTDVVPVETYTHDLRRGELVRSIARRDGTISESRVGVVGRVGSDLHAAYDSAWLRSGTQPPLASATGRSVNVADIFSGCGLMTLGVVEACRALNYGCTPSLAIDCNLSSLGVYAENFPSASTLPVAVETYLDRDVGDPASPAERELTKEVGRIEMLVGGPPCQGHSDLNNHTRRKDWRNALFIKMARFAELVRPTHIIIENVRGILHDRDDVYSRTRKALMDFGYHVDAALLNVADFGVAQRRQRFIVVASLRREVKLAEMTLPYRVSARSFAWACADLKASENGSVFESAPVPSATNQKRIEYLFKENLDDLPDSMRPDCHRLKSHSYRSVYGRLRWDQPSPTITTGFGSMGQGRYVHPLLPRTITPHEAARLQYVPDFFHFGVKERTGLAEMIGNGVPPKLTYLLALELFR